METGIDAVEIGRIAKSMENPRFLERVFSAEERAYFETKGNAPQTVAGHFAAKEAFSKAMGTGIWDFDLREAAVCHDSAGKPSLKLAGTAKELGAGWTFSVSITHTREVAIALVMAYEEAKP